MPSGSSGYNVKKPKPVPRYEDAIVEVPFNTSGPTWDWIKTLVGPDPSVKKQVVLTEVNSDYRETVRRTLSDTKLTRLELPALDGSVTTAMRFKLGLTPTIIAFEKGSGALVKPLGQKQKVATSNRFTVAIEGMESRRVAYVESFVISRSARDVPQFSALALHVPDSDMATWRSWASQGTSVKKTGSITWLDAANNTLLSLDMRGLNVSGLSALGTKVPNGISRTRVVLNVEGATFATVGP